MLVRWLASHGKDGPYGNSSFLDRVRGALKFFTRVLLYIISIYTNTDNITISNSVVLHIFILFTLLHFFTLLPRLPFLPFYTFNTFNPFSIFSLFALLTLLPFLHFLHFCTLLPFLTFIQF